MVEVIDVPDEHRYVISVDGARAGLLDYQLRDGVLVALHTEIDPTFEGQGLGGILVQHVLDQVRATGLTLLPLCPFVRGFLARHPGYADLVADSSTAEGAS